MHHDLYDYDHPALYMNLVEPAALRRAKRICGKINTDRALGSRKVRRVIKLYLRHDSVPRIDSRAAGDSWEIW